VLNLTQGKKVMKRLFNCILALTLGLGISSCSKDENLDVDLTKYNYDTFEKLPIDDYINTNLTVPYNIEVVYRFDRSQTDINKNISPPKIEQVQPAVDMVINGFLKVFEKVAGPTFIKTYTPKQFVLFGSHAYNSNGSVTLGTADGGRRVVLYDINNVNPNSPTDIKRRLRTIHHEFTHIVNQIVAIPPSFREVTTDNVADWTAAANTDAEALRLGFISQYSRSNFGEDFAETVAHLLIEGQAYYNQRIAASSEDGAKKLRAKQTIVEDYYKQFFNIDFKELQYEVYLMLNQTYGDQSQAFLTNLKNNRVASINFNLDSGTEYTLYGKSAAFDAVWKEVKAKLPTISNNAGRQAVSFNLVFLNENKVQLQAAYKNVAGSNFAAWYDFTITYNPDGTIKLKYIDEGLTDTGYGNGRVVIEGWRALITYLETNTFRPDWVSPTIVGYNNSMKFAGFYVASDETNYLYGPVTLK